MSYKVEDGANIMQVCYVQLGTFHHMGCLSKRTILSVVVRDARRLHDNLTFFLNSGTFKMRPSCNFLSLLVQS